MQNLIYHLQLFTYVLCKSSLSISCTLTHVISCKFQAILKGLIKSNSNNQKLWKQYFLLKFDKNALTSKQEGKFEMTNHVNFEPKIVQTCLKTSVKYLQCEPILLLQYAPPLLYLLGPMCIKFQLWKRSVVLANFCLQYLNLINN